MKERADEGSERGVKLLGFQLRVWSSMTDELTIAAVAVAVDVPLIGGIQSLPR